MGATGNHYQATPTSIWLTSNHLAHIPDSLVKPKFAYNEKIFMGCVSSITLTNDVAAGQYNE
jgi:hypothetical protein